MAHFWFEVVWFALAYPASLLLAVAVGYAVAEVYYRRRGRVWKPSGSERARITVFGLLLSFTLLAANNAHKERTALMHQSADAVAELYRESQLLPATVRAFAQQFSGAHPGPIVLRLLVSPWAIGVLVGFTNSAQEARHYFVPALLVVISALALQAVRDLDNPSVGLLRPSYDSLEDLQRAIEQEPPGAPPR